MAIFLETTLLYTYLFHNIGLNILEHVFRKFQVDPFLLNWWKEVLNYAKNHGCHFEVKTTVFMQRSNCVSATTGEIYKFLIAYCWHAPILTGFFFFFWTTRSKTIRESKCINGEKTAGGTESLGEKCSRTLKKSISTKSSSAVPPVNLFWIHAFLILRSPTGHVLGEPLQQFDLLGKYTATRQQYCIVK